LLRGEGVKERADTPPRALDGALGGGSQEGLELGEDLLDGIEIGAVGRQEQELATRGADGAADALGLMAAEIIDDDDVARFEGGDQDLFDVSEEAGAVDRAVDDARRGKAIAAQSCQEGQRAPVPLRNFPDQLTPARRPAPPACHIGLGPGLVDEDQARGIKSVLIALPACPPAGDVGPILLDGEQCFF
jgi:hypothetical protein